MRRRPQRRVGRRLIAALPQEADIVGNVVPHFRRFRFQRCDRIGDQRQFAVIHHHRLGGVLSGIERLGQDNRHRLADEAHALRSQQRAIGLRRRATVRARKADAAGDRRHIGQVGGGEYREHARHGARRIDIDAADRGVRMVRADQHRVQHAGGLRIGAVIALAGQQPNILAPADRPALQCCHQFFSLGGETRSSGGNGAPRSTVCMLVKAWRAMSATRSMTLPAVCGVTTT